MAYNVSLSDKLSSNKGTDLPYRKLIYSHAAYLRKKYQTNFVSVNEHDAYRFKGNLYGLLRHYGLDDKMIWTVAAINGHLDYRDYDGLKTEFILPDAGDISLLVQRNKILDKNVY